MCEKLEPVVDGIFLALEEQEPARPVRVASFSPKDGMRADYRKEVLISTKIGVETIGEDPPRRHLVIAHMLPAQLNELAERKLPFLIGTALFRGVHILKENRDGLSPIADHYNGIKAIVEESGYVMTGDRLTIVEHVEAG